MSIETGVDKLLQLVSERKQLTVDEAAKALNVSKDTVQEWVTMLQEDKRIDVRYSFSKTLLSEHQVTTEPSLAVPDPREAFIRKIDMTIEQLNTDTAGFDRFRNTFETMKQELGSELDEIQHDLDELNKYTKVHEGIIKDAKKQQESIEKKQAEMSEALAKQQRKYELLMQQINELEEKQPDYVPELDPVSAQSLRDYITAVRRQGNSNLEIEGALLSAGWMKEIIAKFLEEK